MYHESLDSNDRAGATMLLGAGIGDALKVKGRYEVVTMGPVEDRREEYNELRATIAEAKRARNVTLVAYLESLLEQIPIEEKWRDVIDNLVTTVGKNLLLDTILGNSAAGTIAMGLKSAGTAVIADTMASHASWTEVTNIAARLAPSFSAASAGSKTTSATVNFVLTSGSGVTIAGVFVVIAGSTTVSNTTGTLFSAGDFSGGNKTASSGDTVQVTYSLSV